MIFMEIEIKVLLKDLRRKGRSINFFLSFKKKLFLGYCVMRRVEIIKFSILFLSKENAFLREMRWNLCQVVILGKVG